MNDKKTLAAPGDGRAQRLSGIIELIEQRGSVSSGDLASRLSVSPATIRRDLHDLYVKGLISRSHGRAATIGPRPELPLDLRDTRFHAAKVAIARAAVARLPSGPYVVGLSGGTTAMEVARALATRCELSRRCELTVVTNSLTTANILATRAGVRVLMSGGMLRTRSLGLVGTLAEDSFQRVNIGTAILGADGVSDHEGITTHDETEARTNRTMLTNARERVVVADGSKIGQAALSQCCTTSELNTLITDTSASQDELDRIRHAGVDVIVVEPVDVTSHDGRRHPAGAPG